MTAVLTAALLLTALAGCGSGEEVREPTPPLVITDISEETVLMHEELTTIAPEEGEEKPSNPYYRRVTSDSGLVYQVAAKDDGEILSLPVSSTLLYLIGSGEQSYVEQVRFSYTTDDGETHDLEQYRVYAAPAAE